MKHMVRYFEERYPTKMARVRGRVLAMLFQAHATNETTPEGLAESEQIVRMYGITDVWLGTISKTLYIKTKRPGVIIGKRGENINSLEKYLMASQTGFELGVKKIRLIEDNDPLEYYLYAWYRQFSDDY
jgi:hypothetical protein